MAVICVQCVYSVGECLCILDVIGNDGQDAVVCRNYWRDCCYGCYSRRLCVCRRGAWGIVSGLWQGGVSTNWLFCFDIGIRQTLSVSSTQVNP